MLAISGEHTLLACTYRQLAETVVSNRCDNTADCCRQAARRLRAGSPRSPDHRTKCNPVCAPETSVGHPDRGDFRCSGSCLAKNASKTIFYLSVITTANVVIEISYDNDFSIRTCESRRKAFRPHQRPRNRAWHRIPLRGRGHLTSESRSLPRPDPTARAKFATGGQRKGHIRRGIWDFAGSAAHLSLITSDNICHIKSMGVASDSVWFLDFCLDLADSLFNSTLRTACSFSSRSGTSYCAL